MGLDHHHLALSLLLLLSAGCAATGVDPERAAEAQRFLDGYDAQYVDLYAASSEAQWASNTHIVEGDETNAVRTQAADEALAAFTGSAENIETARRLLKGRKHLEDLQVRQLERVLFLAGDNPQTVPDVVKARIAAETAQTEKLYGFTFTKGGVEVTPNQIDEGLRDATDLDERLAVWESSKEVGKVLRPGLIELRRLRNESVRALGYDDFFAYMVSEYGMTTEQLADEIQEINRELRPLFRELHTWIRYRLAERYDQPVPDLIPAHWLPNRWGQDWSEMLTVEGFDLDAALADKSAEWVVQQGEAFYVSLGFPKLPQTFWDKSSLYPLPADATYKKNNHASAWHLDLQNDVRSLMSVQNNARWYSTVHHELGHIYYYISYSTPNVPPLLREGANRGFHEGVGSLMGLASSQKLFLQGRGLIPADAQSDEIQALLKEALEFVVFIPFSAGVMTHFERDLYEGKISPSEYNKRWWAYAAKFQGMVPPAERGEAFCDAATKTHINNDAAQYYDYAISFILLHQLHAHIAKNILKQDPRNTNYYGNPKVGAFLSEILKKGGTEDWRKVMRESLGEEVSAKAIQDYFAPLMAYLKKQNEGRKATLPEL